MTANAMKEDMVLCREAGMDSFIAKPVKEEAVYKVINKLGGGVETASVYVNSAPKNGGLSCPDAVAEFTPPNCDADVFNRMELMERLDNETSYLVRFLGMFIGTAETNLAELGVAIENGDTETVRIKAHTIKGASANIAAGTMKRIASEIEDAAKNGTIEGAGPCYLSLKEAFEDFKFTVRSDIEKV
jgi:HPt (histidine-containing phosphotransfer) domain-containing protein